MTQRDFVIQQLRANGEITRNQCLSRIPAITRLGAIACDLKADGWQLEPSRRGNDYVYKLIETPKRAVYEFDLINGIRVPRKTYVSA